MKYWALPNDGADWRCCECLELGSHTEIVLTETPNGTRQLLHKKCIDLWWWNNAKYMGLVEF